MNQQQLQQFITPFEINKGTVLEGTQVEFEIMNNSPFDFLCFEQSCGCLGKADLLPKSFKGSLTASMSGTYVSNEQFLKIGDRLVQMHHTPKGIKFYDPFNSQWLENEEVPENPEKVAVANFHQSITLWLDDGADIYRISPTGQLETNPDKNRIVIPIRFVVVKKPS